MGFIEKKKKKNHNQQQITISQYDHTEKLLTKNNVLQMNSRNPVLKCLPYKEKTSYKSNLHFL